jgi:isoleucyl-tRNA synthetase
VVDGEGRKQSKSLGNVVPPQEVIDKYGAELLRLWVSSVDYREDIRYSEEIMSRLVDAYRRIRNTCRYLLGNIHDLDLDTLVPVDKLAPLDRFALELAREAHARVEDAYLNFEFHKVYHTLYGLCVTDLSAFYLDIIKDRLYSSLPDSPERRSTQTALYYILMLLLRDMAPVLSFTAEEVFRHIPPALQPQTPTVLACPEQDMLSTPMDKDLRAAWDKVLEIRAEVTKAIEPLRRDGVVGHSLDTHVTLFLGDDLRKLVSACGADMQALCIVSQLDMAPLKSAPVDAYLGEIQDLAISVEKAAGEKCERCWIYSTELGSDPSYPTACPRCAEVLRELAKRGQLEGETLEG